MKNIVTVDYLLSLLKKLSDSGNGNMKIKFNDNFLHQDEIFIDHMDKTFNFNGNIFNCSVSDKIEKFCIDIENAKKRFYS